MHLKTTHINSKGLTELLKERQFGDVAERLFKPIAKAIKSSCLEQDGTLRPDSRCNKIKQLLNFK